jgi:hypothetical protein
MPVDGLMYQLSGLITLSILSALRRREEDKCVVISCRLSFLTHHCRH